MRKVFTPLIALLIFSIPQFTKAELLDFYAVFGYGIGFGGTLLSSTTTVSDSLRPTSKEDHYLNYGHGVKLEAGANYYAMERVPVQFGFIYSFGVPSIEVKKINTDIPIPDSTTTYKRSMFGFKAMIAPRFEVLELVDMYTGVGIGLYFGRLNYETSISTGAGTNNETGHFEAGPAIAFLGSLGADFPLADKISLFGEIGFEQMTFTWNKRVVDKSSTIGRKGAIDIFEKNATNLESPQKVPGTNWQLRFGTRFNIL